MAARLITPEQVAEACNELVRAGEKPTILKVHKMLGQGSPNTVQKFIKLWAESPEAKYAEASRLPTVVELPPEFTEATDIYAKKIFASAKSIVEAQIVQVREQADQAIAEEKVQTQQSMDYAEEISGKNEDLQEQLTKATTLTAALEEQVGALKATVDEKTRVNGEQAQVITELQHQVTEQIQIITGLEKSLALVVQERDQAITVQENLTTVNQNVIKDLKSEQIQAITELKAENKELKTEQAQVIRDLKTESNDNKAEITAAHNKAITELTKAHNKSITDLTAANTKTVEALEQAVTDLKDQRDKLTQKDKGE